jgi:hypothetical protein
MEEGMERGLRRGLNGLVVCFGFGLFRDGL